MSEKQKKISADRLPLVPETQIVEPLVQCGVLYLGTALPSPGRRGLDSVQEPLSHRYPVDGTNTARGIDSVLSLYDNGIQLTFTRQPHVVIFFPISSLVYCASLRFSIVENEQTSAIDWRFVTLDSPGGTSSRHPPLFCAVVQRTQILAAEECHSFITKNDDAALELVRLISEVYANLQPNSKTLRSPVFYQLDRYGRKISETNGTVYLSPDTGDDEAQIVDRNHLLDPTLNGFFYRTDATVIEKWQLWDDDDQVGSRPHPPPSPFGQNQGLYHDDLTPEIHQYLRHMDTEDSHSSSSNSLDEPCHHHQHHQVHSHQPISGYNASSSHVPTSSYDPTISTPTPHTGISRPQVGPIIIEKVLPNPVYPTIPLQSFNQVALPNPVYPTIPLQSFDQVFLSNPVLPTIPQQLINQAALPSIQSSSDNYPPYSSSYEINERGEKITKAGNRIVYMDVVQPDMVNNRIVRQSPIHYKPRSRSHRERRQRPPKSIPMIDIQSVENLFAQRKRNHPKAHSTDSHLSTSDMLEIVEGYFEDYDGKKVQLNGADARTMLQRLEASDTRKKERQSSTSTNSSYHERRRNHSTLVSGPSVNYGQRSATVQQPTFNDKQVNEYVTNIYGSSENIPRSIRSASSKTSERDIPSATNNAVPTHTAAINNPNYISPFRYMQSSVNPLLLQEYNRNHFGFY